MILRWFAVLMFFVLSPFTALAQDQAPPATSSVEQILKPEQLDALVAPIALYPDALLSLVLMASTYPLEVVQADRWVKDNNKLKGDALKAAVDKQAWDDSIKSLIASPDVLSMMNAKLDWTQKLGDAVLAQQPDVMDAIQRLRTRAEANNKLASNTQQKVTKTQGQGGKQVIAIEQTDPDTLYVPYYDPAVVYGGWPYPDYPPYYFGYPGYIGAGLIAAGLAFGAGWALGRWASGGNYWGGGINWNGNINNININRPRVNPLNGSNWQHRPEHRGGVRYNNSNVRQQPHGFPRPRRRPGSSARQRTAAERRSTSVRTARSRPTAERGAAAIAAAERGAAAVAAAERGTAAIATAKCRPAAGCWPGRRQRAWQRRIRQSG